MSEAPVARSRFPAGLTIATAISFAILCGLGTWQLQRLHWKEGVLARLEALKTAPAMPLVQVLTAKTRPEDLAWTRVSIDCGDVAGEPLPLVYGVRDGDVVWRAQAPCAVLAGPYNMILVDRGVVGSLTGQVAPAPRAFDAPRRVVGVLSPIQQLGGDRAKVLQRFADRKPAPLVLMVEQETPAPSGITPAPLPAEISNRHLEYALTWFGLAVTLLFIYAAMLWRRLRP
ncbi:MULTISPECIES: SURF1 family protein [unclassified Caulobacter]|jgi:surfeit locus 1 family protein|uniref:SURF1 family protein n=1 Tax=unclassified Caulobacter TaxID=2648921 RepID=UPI000782F303|nr:MULTISPECIES: SURF1 family protein [unclassified Caulobacter]AZS19727.1 SURF1 family protein [Caulobacter sp. FWC26]